MIECILQVAGKKEKSKYYSHFEKKIFLPVIPPIGGQIHDWKVKRINYQFDGIVLISLEFYLPSPDDVLCEYQNRLLSNGGFEEKDYWTMRRESVYKNK